MEHHHHHHHHREAWGSNLGFLLATIGSAVGLGNMWGFPYKLGANGGFGFLLLYLVLLVCLMMNTAAPKKRNGFREAAVFAAITVLGYTLICASMYATWTAVGDTLILGIQGRYFLAILPFLLLWVVAGRTRRGTAPAGKDLDGMIWSAAEEYGYIAEMILMAVNAFAVIDIYRFLIISG